MLLEWTRTLQTLRPDCSSLTFIKGFHTAWSWKLVLSCWTERDKLCKHLEWKRNLPCETCTPPWTLLYTPCCSTGITELGGRQGEAWEQPRENPAPAQDNCPYPRRVPSSRTEFRVALRQSAVLPGAAQTVTGSAWTRTGSPDCSQAHLDAGLGQAVNDTVHHVLSLNDLGQRTQVSAQLNSIYGLLGFWLQNFERYREKLQLKPARHTLLPD